MFRWHKEKTIFWRKSKRTNWTFQLFLSPKQSHISKKINAFDKHIFQAQYLSAGRFVLGTFILSRWQFHCLFFVCLSQWQFYLTLLYDSGALRDRLCLVIKCGKKPSLKLPPFNLNSVGVLITQSFIFYGLIPRRVTFENILHVIWSSIYSCVKRDGFQLNLIWHTDLPKMTTKSSL